MSLPACMYDEANFIDMKNIVKVLLSNSQYVLRWNLWVYLSIPSPFLSTQHYAIACFRFSGKIHTKGLRYFLWETIAVEPSGCCLPSTFYKKSIFIVLLSAMLLPERYFERLCNYFDDSVLILSTIVYIKYTAKFRWFNEMFILRWSRAVQILVIPHFVSLKISVVFSP